ncbi:non-ribosomal peptide synthetase [Ruminococcus sp.]|uniref:non-ribosomal peptide synthetase n=1 Tax=Ruminococcus sp. TaxID=41978 RepID=UPI0025ED32E3|nr:non-ribosomal peptide synthetase [Ruminococcus sp.]MCR4639220.1 amino acid adenylation domain-containing protein [Ruminococcus sp.]
MDKTRLTDVQLAYLVGRSSALHLGGNSTHGYVEFQGDASPDMIEDAINRLIIRHPMLRTIINDDGTQNVADESPRFIVSCDDISNLTESEQQERIFDYRKKYSGRVFECGKLPMFAVHAFKMKKGVRYCFDADLMIMDRSSFEIFFNELEMVCSGNEDKLPALKEDFFSYALCREENKLKSAQADDEFFNEFIRDFPVNTVIPECKTPAFSGMKFTFIEDSISADKWQTIKNELAQRHIIPTVYLMVCYASALAKWSGENRVAVNVTSAMRNVGHRYFSGVIGDFTDLIIADVELAAGKDIYDVCRQVQRKLGQYMKHSSGGGIRLLRRISEIHNIEDGIPCPYAFTSSIDENGSKLKDNILGKTVYQISQTPQVRLDCQVYEDNEKLYIRFDYPERVNDDNAVREMHAFMLCLAESGSADYSALRQHEYNKTDWDIKCNTLQHLFSENASEHPERIAVICGNKSYTYRELDKRSDDAAFFIEENGCAGKRVAVKGERCFETVALFLGILKTGGSYIPLDPSWPEERCSYAMKQAECGFCISSDTSIPERKENYAVKGSSDDEAYIIFTSGSTGRPKGVMISQKAVCNTILDINDMLKINEKDIIAGISSFCFDLSVYDMFGALTGGCTLLIVRDLQEMNEAVTSHGATIWNTVPAIMELFCTTVNKPASLRKIMLSGDWIPLNLRDSIREKMPAADVYSLGGATEGSIWSIYFPFDKVDPDWKSIPYGYPLRNQQMWILGSDDSISPVNVAGEICIGGAGVAYGYVGDEERTKAQFFVHPQLGRLYRTGDYGVFTDKGYIEFLGRRDFQVKLHGYRIELGEIESVIDSVDEVGRSVANVVNTDNGTQHLLAYVVPKDTEEKICIHTYDAKKVMAEAGNSFEFKVTPENFSKINSMFDRIAIGIMTNALCSTGFFDNTGNKLSVREMCEKGILLEKYEKLMLQWMKVLSEKGFVSFDNGTAVSLVSLKKTDLTELFDDLQKMDGYESLSGYAGFLKTAGDNIADLLCGRENPLNIMFPGGSWDRAENMYTCNPAADYLNEMASRTVTDIAEKMLADGRKKVRILEVGAGIGGTSAAILQSLQDRLNGKIEYRYTDLSDYFTHRAAEKFSQYDFVGFGVYDLNMHPQLQGYEPESFDIIFGANSVHDSAYLVRSLGYLRTMLKNAGALVLLEGTKNQLFYKVTIGLIDGFSGYMDERVKNNEILLSVNEWEQYSRAAGFSDFISFPEKGACEEAFDQHIFVMNSGKRSVHIDTEHILRSISSSLTSYMIPERIFVMNEIPLSPNGKVDRKALPVPVHSLSKIKKEYIAPVDEIQSVISDCFMSVLGQEKISADANIFKEGADSLKAITIVAELEKHGIKTNLSELYKYPSVIELSSQAELISVEDQPQIEISSDKDLYSPFRMTYQQQSYYLGRVRSVTGVRGIPTGGYAELLCRGYDNSKLENAMNMIIDRHEIFRCRFNEDFTVQFMKDIPRFIIPYVDISDKSEDEREKFFQNVRQRMMSDYPDMTKPPLLKMEAAKINDSDAIISLYIDGLILDGWSVELFIGELGSLYNTGEYLYPQKPDFTFKDYVAFLDKQKHTAKYESDREWWMRRIDDLPGAATLPLIGNIMELGSNQGTQNRCGITIECFEALKEKAAARGGSIFSVLLTSFAAVIGRWNMHNRFMLNIPEFNRPDLGNDVDKVMGVYSSFLLYTSDIDANMSFADNLRRTQEEILALKEHNSFTGMEIIREINRRSGDHNNEVLVPIVFGMMPERPNYNENYLKIEKELFNIIYQENHTSFVWIDINVARHGNMVDFNWCSVRGLFDQDMITDMIKMQEKILYTAAKENSFWERPLRIELPERDRNILKMSGKILDGSGTDELKERFAEQSFIVADDELQQMPVGAEGILCVRDEKNGTFIRTGCTARVRTDSVIEICGREDVSDFCEKTSIDENEENVYVDDRTAKRICSIWSEIMGRDIEEDDDFFEVGGDSIMAIKILYKLRDEFFEEYDIRDFYSDHTARGIARTIAKMKEEAI